MTVRVAGNLAGYTTLARDSKATANVALRNPHGVDSHGLRLGPHREHADGDRRSVDDRDLVALPVAAERLSDRWCDQADPRDLLGVMEGQGVVCDCHGYEGRLHDVDEALGFHGRRRGAGKYDTVLRLELPVVGPDQGQRQLDDLPHARTALLRPHESGRVLLLRKRGQERGLPRSQGLSRGSRRIRPASNCHRDASLLR